MSKIYFFRHAQASAGKENYDVLSKKGEQQAEILGEYLVQQGLSFDQVYVGPLVRQQHTCEIVGQCFKQAGHDFPDVTTLSGLKEHQGPDALKSAFPQLLQTDAEFRAIWAEGKDNPKRRAAAGMKCFRYFMQRWSEGEIDVPGFTSWATFRKETDTALQTILRATDSGQTVAAFTSGGTISAITGSALSIPSERKIAELNYSVRNTSFTSFFYSRGVFNLLGFNEVPHVQGEMVTFV